MKRVPPISILLSPPHVLAHPRAKTNTTHTHNTFGKTKNYYYSRHAMGNCNCGPKKPAGAEHQIATLMFAGTYGCRHPFTFKKSWCCGPCAHRAPDHPGWRAAEPELDILFGEVPDIVRASPKCCGCGIDYAAITALLRASGWLDRMNAALGPHGLVCDLHQFTTVVSNGTSTQVQQHLHLRVFELNDGTRALYNPSGAAMAGGYGSITGADSVKTGPSNQA